MSNYQKMYPLLTWIGISLVCLLLISCNTATRHQEKLNLLIAHHTSQAITIYSAKYDGSQLREIGSFPSTSIYWLSPTGKYLAVLDNTMQIIDVVSGKPLLSLDNAGQTRFESISKNENIAWAPQESKLAFLRNSMTDDGLEVVMLDLQNNTETVLPTIDGIFRAPAWSPDGNYVAWASLSNSCNQAQCTSSERQWNIMIAEVNSITMHEIDLSTIINEDQPGIWQRSLCNLSWSPTGMYLAFENVCDVYGPLLNKEVFVVSVTGSPVYQVTNFSDKNNPTASAFSLNWHPFNNDLAVAYTVTSFEPLTPGQYQEGVILFRMNGTTSPEISTYDILNHTAIWSPDGEKVLWYPAANSSTLFLSQFTDTRAINITPVNFADHICFIDFEPKIWSPDNQLIAVVVGEKILNGDYDFCDSRNGTSVAIISSDGRTWQLIGEQLQGKKQVVGWFIMDP